MGIKRWWKRLWAKKGECQHDQYMSQNQSEYRGHAYNHQGHFIRIYVGDHNGGMLRAHPRYRANHSHVDGGNVIWDYGKHVNDGVCLKCYQTWTSYSKAVKEVREQIDKDLKEIQQANITLHNALYSKESG